MRILVGHNQYQRSAGEDAVVSAETALLSSHGHEVLLLSRHNAALDGMGRLQAVEQTVWSRASYHEVQNILREHRVDVAHFHNTFPLMSPSVYYACRDRGVPVVQTLHNYRLICPSSTLFRQGRVCTDCVGKPIPWPGVVHACYRGSRAASGATALMLGTHQMLRTWRRTVNRYIAVSESVRRQFVLGGFPGELIAVKPNFVAPDPGLRSGAGGYALFLGRLIEEKGIRTLLQAWELLESAIPLRIAGEGPLGTLVKKAAERSANIQWVGQCTPLEARQLLAGSYMLVMPSVWLETFGLVIIEAYAHGVPVVGSDIGGPGTLIEDGVTGFHHRAGDPVDLAHQVTRLWELPKEAALMGAAGRRIYEDRYTADVNYSQLMAVYAGVMRGANGRSHPGKAPPDA